MYCSLTRISRLFCFAPALLFTPVHFIHSSFIQSHSLRSTVNVTLAVVLACCVGAKPLSPSVSPTRPTKNPSNYTVLNVKISTAPSPPAMNTSMAPISEPPLPTSSSSPSPSWRSPNPPRSMFLVCLVSVLIKPLIRSHLRPGRNLHNSRRNEWATKAKADTNTDRSRWYH